MKIGITGGAGYIGSYLVKRLADNRDEVISVDNEEFGDYCHLRELDLLNVNLVNGDIRDIDSLLELWEGCDAVVHLAALSNLEICDEDPEKAISTNIYGTHQVMAAAKQLGIGKVVFCSSAAVYGEPDEIPISENTPLRPLNLYGVTKIAGEKIVDSYWMNHGIETVNLRFGNIYGVGLFTPWYAVTPKFVKQALNGEDLTVYGTGEATRDYIHLEDITTTIMKILDSGVLGGETFNLGGETLSVNQIADMVIEEVKKKTEFSPSVINTEPRKGETEKFSYDLTKMRTLLKVENSWSVREGIRQIIDYSLEE